MTIGRAILQSSARRVGAAASRARKSAGDPLAWIGIAGAVICSLAAAFPVDAADPPGPAPAEATIVLPCWPYDAVADALEGEGLARYGGGALTESSAPAGIEVELWLGADGAFASVLRRGDGGACITRGAKFKRLGPRLKGKGA